LPGRDLIIFITFGVILFTLVGQGLTLPMVIRWLGLKGDDIGNQEERQARLEGAHAALARLEALAYTTPEAMQLIDRVRVPYRERVEYLGGQVRDAAGGLSDAALALTCSTIEEIQREAIRAERLWLIRLRDDDVIGDDVLRIIMRELDLEETALLEEGDGEHGHG
jgi:CPA1 family monovalent cation:H+ antiporter